MISKVAIVIFFLVFGLTSLITTFPGATVVEGFAALVASVAMMLNS